MKKFLLRYSKQTFFLAIPLILILLAFPLRAQAIIPLLGPAAIALAAFAILYILQYIGAIFFNLAGYLLGFFLDFNYTILQNNNLITMGWSIMRDLANLGFVLVIIIIAFATILRYQTYGAQRLLPKLIAAAIIINFSLTIAGVFINFSHVLTRYFLAPIGGHNIKEVVTTISGAFDPQNLFAEPAEPEPIDPEDEVGGLEKFATSQLLNIASLFFTVIFTFAAAFVLSVFAFMLLIRYLYLSFLLILAPITWLFWVVPNLSGQFSGWWKNFFKWVFFAPASAFFIYLALMSVTLLSQSTSAVTPQEFFKGGMLPALMAQGAKMFLLMGLLIGGLIAAQNMSIYGAKGAVAFAQGVGKKTQAWAGRQALRASTLPLRTPAGRKTIEGLQKAGVGLEGKWGGLGTAVSGLLRPVRFASSKASTIGVQQGEKLVSKATEAQKKMSSKQLALAIHSMSRDQQIAALIRLTKEKNLDMIPNFTQFIANSNTKRAFENYGRGKEYGDMEKTARFNTAMLTGKDENGKPISLEDATEKFVRSYSMKDHEKAQVNIYRPHDKNKNNLGLDPVTHEIFKNLMTSATFKVHPGAISTIRKQLKNGDLLNFQKELDTYIEDFEKEISMPASMREITFPIKARLEFIDKHPEEKIRERANWVRGIYNARKNFAGSLFGGFAPFAEGGEEKEETA